MCPVGDEGAGRRCGRGRKRSRADERHGDDGMGQVAGGWLAGEHAQAGGQAGRQAHVAAAGTGGFDAARNAEIKLKNRRRRIFELVGVSCWFILVYIQGRRIRVL